MQKKEDNISWYLNEEYPEICEAVSISDDATTLWFHNDIKAVDLTYLPRRQAFLNITTIHIGKNIMSFYIPNKMFPNVRKIESENPSFPSGTMLVRVDDSGKRRLLNSFYLKPDETLNLSGINMIEPEALIGCAAGKIIGTEDLTYVEAPDFLESEMEFKYGNGVWMAGSIVICADDNAEEYVIPQNATLLANDIEFENVPIVFENNAPFNKCDALCLPDEIYLNGIEQIPLTKLICLRKNKLHIGPNNPKYYEKDGMIMSKDKKVLYFCSKNIPECANIPDTVESICDNAFLESNIKSINIPGFVKRIGDAVFEKCSALESIKMHNGLEEIGKNCFIGCKKLKNLEIPGTVEIIDDFLAKYSSLDKVVLNEGTKFISHLAFRQTKVREIVLPSSITFLEAESMESVDKIVFSSDTLPRNLVYALYELSNACSLSGGRNLKTPYVCVSTPSRTLYFPSDMETSGLDEITETVKKEGINAPANFWKYSRSFESYKLLMAIQEYKEQSLKETKEYLLSNVISIINYCINENDEKLLCTYISFAFLNNRSLKYALARLEETRMTSAKAYVLTQMDKIKKTEKFAL